VGKIRLSTKSLADIVLVLLFICSPLHKSRHTLYKFIYGFAIPFRLKPHKLLNIPNRIPADLPEISKASPDLVQFDLLLSAVPLNILLVAKKVICHIIRL